MNKMINYFYQFDSPIVAIWREDAAKLYSESSNKYILEPIDLFDSSQWIWGPHFEKRPNLYLGMYEKQLYVQENHKNLLDLNYVQHAKYPWRPYPAASKSIKLSHTFPILHSIFAKLIYLLSIIILK